MTAIESDQPSNQSDVERNATASKRKRYILYGVVALVGLLLVWAVVWWFSPHSFYGTVIQSPEPAADFMLVTSDGEEKSLSDFRGKYVVLNFGYTFCPDVCPMTLAEMSSMADALGPNKMDDVQVIFVTLDPERDTPEQLANYLSYFSPDFIGMTGELADIDPVASQFGVFYEHVKQEGQETGVFGQPQHACGPDRPRRLCKSDLQFWHTRRRHRQRPRLHAPTPSVLK
ncbi:MAG: SCO family protein [Caldilineaceae bacterium]|nr:SCO family protein [Caldilineaceae bacterium]